jgi:rRNA-processing protein FCF1
MPPRTVILDTNFLLLPFQFKIDVMHELEYLLDFSHSYVVSSKTVEELERLGASPGKHGAAARVGLKTLEANKDRIEVIKDERHVDDWIADYAQESNAIVCTNDKGLRKRLKTARVKVITLKSKSRLGYV